MSCSWRLLLVSSCLLLVAACSSPSAGRTTLVLAIQPTANPESLAAESNEIKAFLEARLDDVEVEIRVPTLYAGVIEALRFGNAHAAFMSAWPAALASRHAGAEVALAEIREVTIGEELQEQPFYYSYWIVMRDSPHRTLEELKGARVAFPSPLSTSGFVFPMARLVQLGLVEPGEAEADPSAFFGQVAFAGGYAQGWQALRMGQADVAIIAGDVPETLYREVLDQVRIVEEQGPIPSHAVVFGRQLEEPLRSQLRQALLDLGDEAHRPLMRRFVSGIFVRFEATTTERHLAGLLDAMTLTNLQYAERLR